MMRFTDVLGYSVQNLRRRKLRSYLTILGIILGIATIVVLVSVGEGVKKDIDAQLEAFGPEMIAIAPYEVEDVATAGVGMTFSGKLYKHDIGYIERVPGIEEISYGTFGRASVRFRDKEIGSLVMAVTPNMFPMYSSYIRVEEGRYFEEGEKHVVFLAYDAANDLFGKDKISVNNYIYINGIRYRVVGIAEEIGTSLSAQDDSAIYIPYDDSEEIFGKTLAKDELSYIMVSVQPGVGTKAAAERIEEQLAASHRVSLDNKDFTVYTQEYIMETVNNITTILTGSLFLIGLISAIVGGIGIANTMFMSVLERTKEIGILKSIGASSWQILSIFLMESALIGGIGGLIGLGLGFMAIQVIPYFGITPYLATEVAIGAVLFAIGVGMVSGFIPARNASKIPAVEALSYD
ncbi:MAG: ABC transporter permease [candidate division WOR-3 bacterium]